MFLITKGPVASHELVTALHARFTLERDILMSRVKSDSHHKMTSKQVVSEYCRLVRQHISLQDEADFVNAALAVGLAERDVKNAATYER